MDASPSVHSELFAHWSLDHVPFRDRRLGLAIWASLTACTFVTSGAFAQSPSAGATVIPLNQSNAQATLSYGAMACAAYVDCATTKYLAPGYKEDLSWQDVLRRAAPGRDISSTIKTFEQAGFSATIFRNDQTKEIVVAIRGSEGNAFSELTKYTQAKIDQRLGLGANDLNGDWQTDFRARFDVKSASDKLEAQYVAARLLARAVDKSYSPTPYASYTHVLTGHSLGGGLSLYAGKYVSAQVYAFDPSGNVLSAGERTARQHIIVAENDPVSDPRMGVISKLTGASKVSGTVYSVGFVSDKVIGNPIQTLPAQHGINAMVTRLASIADGTASTWDYHANQAPLGLTAGSTPQRFPVQPDIPSSGVNAQIAPATTPSIRLQDQAARATTSSPQLIAPRSQQSAAVILPSAMSPASKMSAPGGVSLSSAAAQRLPLNLSIEAAVMSDDKVILAGRKNLSDSIDAALLLTALRVSCEEQDPYFSLDPDDLTAWQEATSKVGQELGAYLDQEFATRVKGGRNPREPSLLYFRTISGSQNFPSQWATILIKYPALKSRLVFRPEWLRQTRFGEILYKADVLLKELAGGAPILGDRLRASMIDDYRSSIARRAASLLLGSYSGQKEPLLSNGGRIWYDLTESSDISVSAPQQTDFPNSELRNLLARRGLISENSGPMHLSSLAESDGALDLSNVYPLMFVRVTDPVSHQDSSARFPGLNELAADANRVPQKYSNAYGEYRQLIEAFRAYIVAVRVKQNYPGLCKTLPSQLLDSEKLQAPLPKFHPTDLAVTAGWYEYTDGHYRRVISGRGGLFQGGVSVGATRFLSKAASRDVETQLVRQVRSDVGRLAPDTPSWVGSNDLHYVALSLEVSKMSSLPPVASLTLESSNGQRYSDNETKISSQPVGPRTPDGSDDGKGNERKKSSSPAWGLIPLGLLFLYVFGWVDRYRKKNLALAVRKTTAASGQSRLPRFAAETHKVQIYGTPTWKSESTPTNLQEKSGKSGI